MTKLECDLVEYAEQQAMRCVRLHPDDGRLAFDQFLALHASDMALQEGMKLFAASRLIHEAQHTGAR